MANVTTPFDISPVKGYPKTLQIYKIPASKFWQVRMFVDRKYIRKSTRCVEIRDAFEFAKEFYDTIRINQRQDINVHTDTFVACAQHLMEQQKSLVNRGARDARIVTEDRKKLEKDILPFFRGKSVGSVDAQTLKDYLNQLTAVRKLSPSTLNKHLVVIRKVLNEGKSRNYIKTLPAFPTVSRKDNPRPYFNYDEFEQLKDSAEKLSEEGLKVRGVPLTAEIHDLIKFHVNCFIRPSDIKLLQNKHVTEDKTGDNRFLLIIPPRSKTVKRESVSMAAAVTVYQNLIERHKQLGLAEDDDYVFFPQYREREYALQTMRRQFDFILQESGLKYDRWGNARTLYSLRHTALMLRLLKGDNINIFFLARNALTSVDQLERFYLSHAEPKMMVQDIQSFADGKLRV